MPELDGRIEAAKRQVDELLRNYTEQHPDVVGGRRLMARLEEERNREIEVRRKAAAERPDVLPSGDPVTEQLKVALNEAEANVITVRARVAEFEARYTQLKANAESLPKIDTEWTQLNRDYDIQKRQYESLVARRETASMTGKLEDAGIAEFRIIDPPRVTPIPVAPNRCPAALGPRCRVARRRSRGRLRGEPGSPDLSRWPRSARDRRPSIARHGQHDCRTGIR